MRDDRYGKLTVFSEPTPDNHYEHVVFLSSVIVCRLSWPPEKGDFYRGKYFTGKRWVRRSRKELRKVRRLGNP